MEKLNEILTMEDKEEITGLKELKIKDVKPITGISREKQGSRKEEVKKVNYENLRIKDGNPNDKRSKNDSSNSNNECLNEHFDLWKKKQEQKIEEKKKRDKKLKEQIRNKAKIKIEELQMNYEKEVDDRIKKVEEEEKKFLSNAKSFYTDNSIWNKTNKIIDEIGTISETNARDKTRFRKLLKNYKKNKMKSHAVVNNRF